ncbi:MAG: sugar ABC transporter permease [Chloroflexota bacterium]|nr:MAG: sugar ABC transporter permease [Chloroflexota bacterium]
MRTSAWRRRDVVNGLLFASPWILGFLVFTLGPIVAALYYSFTEFNIIQTPRWIGLGNFQAMGDDELFWTSLYNTAFYALFHIPLVMVAALAAAMLTNEKLPGQTIFRTAIFVPSVVSGVALAVVFAVIFAGDFGLLNKMLRIVGIHGPQWLGSMHWSKPAFILMSLWGIGSGMVIYLAGLQAIPAHLYEAASIDGAGPVTRFLNVTVPLLTPTIFFHMITTVIGSFQIFTYAYVLTGGGPADSTLFYVLYLYRLGFEYFKMGYASAFAWVLFVVVLALTIAQFLLGRRWVHYEEEAAR